MVDCVSGEEKCGATAPNGASVCALPSGHDGGHRNAWSTAEWPASSRCSHVYDPNGDRCAFGNGAAQHDHRTATGLGYVHQDQWRPVQTAEHTPQTGGPGMQLCGNVGPFDGITCERTVGHSGHHQHSSPRGAVKSKLVWSDVTDESAAKQLAGLQRKVRAQANQINKLEELRRAVVDKQPEYQQLLDQLKLAEHNIHTQASLTEREHQFRVRAQQERDSDRERRAELITNQVNDIRHHFGEPSVAGSATWADLRAQVARLIDRERQFRIRAQRELVSVTDLGDVAEGVRGALVKLEHRVDELDTETVRRCESWNSGTRCVGYAGHNGAHHDGSGTERWV